MSPQQRAILARIVRQDARTLTARLAVLERQATAEARRSGPDACHARHLARLRGGTAR